MSEEENNIEMNEEENTVEEIEEVPEELYAPLGDATYEKPKKEVVPEYVSYKDVKLDFAKKPFNAKKLLYWMVGIIVVALFCTAGFLYVKNKKNVYRVWLNTESKKGTSILYSALSNKLFHLSNGTPFLTSFLIDFGVEYDEKQVSKEEKEMLDTLKNTNISYTLGIDLQKKEFTHALKSTYKNENLFTVYGNGYEDTINFLIREVTGRYISLPNYFKFLFINDKQQKKDLENFRKYSINTLLSHIEESDLKEEKKKVVLDGKEETLRDVSLLLDEEKMKAILSDFTGKLEKNKKWKEKITSYFAITEEEIKNFLDKVKNKEWNPLEVHLYAKEITNKIVGFQITVHADSIYEFEKWDGSSVKWNLKKDGETVLSLTKEDTKIQGILFGNTIQMEKTSDNEYFYFFATSKDAYRGKITINDTELELSKKGNVHFTIEHQGEKGEFISKIDSSIIYNTNTTNSISLYNDDAKKAYQDLKEEEKKEIINRIMKTDTVNTVYKSIQNYIKKIRK